jgi:hypothetical protein
MSQAIFIHPFVAHLENLQIYGRVKQPIRVNEKFSHQLF